MSEKTAVQEAEGWARDKQLHKNTDWAERIRLDAARHDELADEVAGLKKLVKQTEKMLDCHISLHAVDNDVLAERDLRIEQAEIRIKYHGAQNDAFLEWIATIENRVEKLAADQHSHEVAINDILQRIGRIESAGGDVGEDRKSPAESIDTPPVEPLVGVEEIMVERERQISEEKWTPEHDDKHNRCEMSTAAALYALHGTPYSGPRFDCVWPWSKEWDKRGKHDRRRRLIIAGALIAAEIDRHDRLTQETAYKLSDATPPAESCSIYGCRNPAVDYVLNPDVDGTGRSKNLPYCEKHLPAQPCPCKPAPDETFHVSPTGSTAMIVEQNKLRERIAELESQLADAKAEADANRKDAELWRNRFNVDAAAKGGE